METLLQGWREPQVPPLRYAPVGMTTSVGATAASCPGANDDRSGTADDTPWHTAEEFAGRRDGTAPRAAACPTAAAWFQRPSRRRKHRAQMAPRQLEKPTPAARGRTRWPCASTCVTSGSEAAWPMLFSSTGSLSVNRAAESSRVVLITCTHGIVRLLHSRAHPGRLRPAPPRSNTATPGRRRWSCGQYP